MKKQEMIFLSFFLLKAMECIICYNTKEEIPERGKWIKCSCKTTVCEDCFKTYMSHSLKQLNKLPVCPYCHREYLYDQLRKNDILLEYIDILFDFLKKNPNFMNVINNKVKINNMIKNIRESKLNFMKAMPKCVLFYAKVI